MVTQIGAQVIVSCGSSRRFACDKLAIVAVRGVPVGALAIDCCADYQRVDLADLSASGTFLNGVAWVMRVPGGRPSRPSVSRAPRLTVIKRAAMYAVEFAKSRIGPNLSVLPGGKFVIIAPSQCWGR